jgi:glycosyltransferase involved in cell wall biosynthesis
MRILQLNTFWDRVGGAEIYLHGLVDALRERGHDVAVFASSLERELDEPQARVVKRPEFDGARLVRDEALTRALRELVARFRPELVHAHNLAAFPVELVAELRALDLPMLQTVHDFSVLCPNSWCVWPDGTVCEGGPGAKCFRHGCEENYPYDGRVVLAAHLRYRLIPKTFDAFLCPSRYLADKLGEHGFAHAEGLPLWIDADGATRPVAPAERDPDHVLFLGRLVKEKGVAYLVEAMPHVRARRPAARLSIVGGGPEREPLERLAARLGVADAVVFHGKVPHADVQRFFASATVQVLPSIWCENSPVTTYESFLTGLPMVASRIAGLPAMVREGETGLLATPRDPADLAAKIVQVLADPELQRRLSEGCTAALARYTREKHMARLLEVYDEVVARHRARAAAPAETPAIGDDDLIASLDRLFADHSKLERWALDMKAHIDYLESTGMAGKPVQRFARHLYYLAKSRLRRRRAT